MRLNSGLAANIHLPAETRAAIGSSPPAVQSGITRKDSLGGSRLAC